MKLLIQIVLLSVVVSSGGIATSAGNVIVRTKAEPSSPWVGQKVTLTIDVLARDGWATIKAFPLLDVQGAYLHRYESQGTRLNEDINGASYTGQRYEVLLFAQTAGELTINSFPIEVSTKTWGADATTESEKLSTEPVVLSVSSTKSVFPGAYLPATTEMAANQVWSSQKKEYQTGDAIERTVTRTAKDMSAMAFEPLDLPEINGMSCYPDQPEVNDSFNRGDLIATRIDKVSCILELPGEYTFPVITVSYWNINTKDVDNLSLQGLSFTVKDGTDEQPSVGRTSSTVVDNRNLTFLITGLILLCVSVWFFRKKLFTLIQDRKNKRKFTEKYLFSQVKKALKVGDRYIALAAIMSWLDVLPGMKHPTRFDEFARRFGNEEMVLMLEDLNRRTNWTEKQYRLLYELLKQGRTNFNRLNQGKTAKIKELPSVGLKTTSTSKIRITLDIAIRIFD